MLKAKDIEPGTYIMRNEKRIRIGRVWMGIIYSSEKTPTKGCSLKVSSKHVWFNNGNYNLNGKPHELDLMERIN